MSDMLAATKQGDRQKVDALIKQTEFADYARYFVRTYSPDPLAAEDWNITYRQYVSDNENEFRGLLKTLAKDEGGKILVRKANDNPAPGRGFEWGMVHYARIPIDVYCVTLVFSHSPDGPGESSVYYVFADGMFRWDSIVPFAKPGTYQSDPGTLNGSQTQATGSAQYPNTPDGLREFLSELRAAAKSGDQVKIDSMIKQTEIPEYRNWEWGMIHNSRTPLDIYHAAWKPSAGAAEEWIGYFIYIGGMFRLESTVRWVPVVRVSPASDR